MRVVVTGGAGFIGANLCAQLSTHRQTTEVIALDDLSTGFASNLGDVDAKLVVGSILDRDVLADTVDTADAVVHLAARPSVPRSLADPVAGHAATATGTLYVLEAARAAGAHVVVASSSSVYGATKELPKHELLPTRPLSPYAVSKLATEAYTLAYATSFDLRTLAFRFFNVYGPLQPAGHAYAAVVPAFIDAALRDAPLTVYGDGRQTRDFTYVGTVTRVITDAVVRGVTAPQPVQRRLRHADRPARPDRAARDDPGQGVAGTERGAAPRRCPRLAGGAGVAAVAVPGRAAGAARRRARNHGRVVQGVSATC